MVLWTVLDAGERLYTSSEKGSKSQAQTSADNWLNSNGKSHACVQSESVICGKTTSTVDSYSLGCGK